MSEQQQTVREAGNEFLAKLGFDPAKVASLAITGDEITVTVFGEAWLAGQGDPEVPQTYDFILGPESPIPS